MSARERVDRAGRTHGSSVPNLTPLVPRPKGREAGASEVREQRMSTQQAWERRVQSSQAVHPRACDQRVRSSQAVHPRACDPRARSSQAVHPRACDPRVQSPRAQNPRARQAVADCLARCCKWLGVRRDAPEKNATPTTLRRISAARLPWRQATGISWEEFAQEGLRAQSPVRVVDEPLSRARVAPACIGFRA